MNGAQGRSNPWITVVVLCFGSFMILLDSTIVYMAVPSIMSGLHASFDQVLWMLNAYLLSFAVLLIVAGKLGDIAGPRNVFVAGLAIFTAASAWGGLAPDANQLIAARVLGGVGHPCWRGRPWHSSPDCSPRTGVAPPSACGVRSEASAQWSGPRLEAWS